jgi:hypothetical protein
MTLLIEEKDTGTLDNLEAGIVVHGPDGRY